MAYGSKIANMVIVYKIELTESQNLLCFHEHIKVAEQLNLYRSDKQCKFTLVDEAETFHKVSSQFFNVSFTYKTY